MKIKINLFTIQLFIGICVLIMVMLMSTVIGIDRKEQDKDYKSVMDEFLEIQLNQKDVNPLVYIIEDFAFFIASIGIAIAYILPLPTAFYTALTYIFIIGMIFGAIYIIHRIVKDGQDKNISKK